MMFGLGPVLRYELITTARRGRYYLARVVYGLALLFLLSGQFRSWEQMHPGGGTVEEVQQFADGAFIWFAGAQGAALLCLIPALTAGVIADEHQRKTLHYLLASRLSSLEIVLGKLGARLVHVGVFVALGLPVVCLLGLYGGINPVNVLLVYGGTATVVLLVSGLSILVSTLARRPREAIVAVYGVEAVWLMGPPAIRPFAGALGWPLEWVEPVNRWLLLSNPVVIWEAATYQPGFNSVWMGRGWVLDLHGAFFWMAGMQSALGLLFLVLAVVGLRPLRGSSWPGSEPKKGWWTRLREKLRAAAETRAAAALARNELLATVSSRPACGDRPMLWKERYTSIGGGLRWLSGRPVMLFLCVLLGCYLFDVTWPVVARMVEGRDGGSSRLEINASIRFASTALGVLGMMAVAAASAVSLTGEREQDTWTSLSTTLLTPSEIILAKQFGAVWSARRIGLTLGVLWSVGLLAGAIHPLALPGTVLVVGVGAWFLAAVGVFVSERSRNSTRALVTTFIILFITAGNLPLTLWASLLSYPEAARLWSGAPAFGFDRGAVSVGASGLISPAVMLTMFVLAAGLLTSWSIRRLRASWGQS